MEISENASTCGLLEDEREKVNRRLRALRGQRSASMRPTRLAALVQGRLSMPLVSNQFYITKGEMKRRLSPYDSSIASPRQTNTCGEFRAVRSAFLSPYRFYLVFAAITCVFCSLAGRLVYLQVVKGDALRDSAQNARQNFSVLLARRGDIVDAKGNLFATTRSLVEVGVDPQAAQEEGLMKVSKLAELLQVSEQEIIKAFSNKTRPGNEFSGEVRPIRWTKIADDVEEDVYQRLMELEIKGVYGNFKHSRLYPGNKLASHVIGFVNKEGVPSMGVEKTVDYYLRGQAGWREWERDGRRRELLQYRTREVPSEDGLNVELSIDRMIQDMVERELASIVEEYHPMSA